MERRIDPDWFGLAYARVKTDGSSFRIIECNERFTELSGFDADGTVDVAELAFGGRKVELLEHFEMKKEVILPFVVSGKTIRTRIHKIESDLYELMGIDYTLFQRKQDLFSFRTNGYVQFIKNLKGVSFQRMLKPETVSVFTEGALEELTGYTADQAKDLATWLEIIHPDDRNRMRKVGLELYERPGYQGESEYRIVRKDGEVRWMRSYDNHFLSDDGVHEMVQGLIVDVSVQKQQEERIREQNTMLEEMSMTDHLTGLSNRRFMHQVLNHFISDYKRSGYNFSLLMIDLDRFKEINDKYGHDCGDSVIVEMAEILISYLRETDIKARWGGEEFLVLLPRTGLNEAVDIAEKLLQIVREKTIIHNKLNIKFTFSCGVTVHDRKLSSEVLLKQADRALYRAKENGRNRVCAGEI